MVALDIVNIVDSIYISDYIYLICRIVFMTGFLLIPEYAFLITSLGLFSVYWYSICLHAYNESIIWELFYDRCGCYKPKIIDRGLFGRRKTRNISYGLSSFSVSTTTFFNTDNYL